MMSAIFKSIESRLILLLGIATLLFSLVAGSITYHRALKSEYQHSRTIFNNLAETVQTSASIAVFARNITIAQDVAEGLLKNEDIIGIEINGRQDFHFARKKIAFENTAEFSKLTYALLSPTFPHEEIGHLHLLINEARIETTTRSAAFNQMLVLIAQTILLAIVLALGHRKIVGQPLIELTEELVHISPGSQKRIQIKKWQRNNELGLLAESINHYLDISERALITERTLLTEQQRLAHTKRLEAHYRGIFESAKVGIMVLNMDGLLINCNAAASSRAGICVSPELSNKPSAYLNLIFKYPQKAWALIEQARSSGLVVNGDLELLNNEGESRWAHCLFSIGRFPEEDQHYIEAVFYDVTSRRMREEKALRSAERDVLTDLINRRGALAYLEQALVDARLEGKGVTLFFFDLDGFKSVNDTYGHAAGDIVLVEVARRLRGVRKRSSDLLARLGGDEFVLAAYGLHKTDDGAHQLAQALLTTMQTPIALEQGQTACIGVSIGIAGYPENADNVAALLETADQAMYSAKKRGKNRYQVAASKM
jgi:diguanylate cyclase (GGDEF)-like protein/PAS domain S-box-containing protein